MANLVVVPVRPSILDLPAVEDTLRLVHMAGALARTVIVLNAIPGRTDEGKEAAELLATMGPLLPERLGERVDFRRALVAGKGVTEFAPTSKAVAEVEALYAALEHRASETSR